MRNHDISRGSAVAVRAALTLLAICLSACSAPAEPSATRSPASPVIPPPVGPIPHVGSVRGLKLPTDAYRPTAAQLNTIAAAEERVLTACMSRFGFTWTPRTPGSQQINQADRLYGVGDLPTAQRWGYHLPPGDDRADTQDPLANPSLSPQKILAFTGSPDGRPITATPSQLNGQTVPAGGCWGHARREVTGVDAIDLTRIADSITIAMWEASKTDPRVITVVDAWSSCMNTAGYDYPSPLAVGDGHSDWSQTAPVTDAEIRTAVVDVRCKQETNLIGVWFTVESAYEERAIDQHRTELTMVRDQWRAATETAVRLLGIPGRDQRILFGYEQPSRTQRAGPIPA